MPTFIVSYDLKWTQDPPHPEFLRQAPNFGWQLWVLTPTNDWYRLPNTTLAGTFLNLASARAAFEATRAATAAAKGSSVVVEKLIIADYGEAWVNSDVKQPA